MRYSSLLPSAERFYFSRFVRLAALSVALVGLLPSCSDDDETEATPASPAKITVPQAALHPEGIQYDEANKRFLVSSRTRGQIGSVKDDSTYTVFADDPRLVSTIGLNLDATRQRLLAAVSDNGANTSRSTSGTLRQLAALAIFNATNGSLTSFVNLGALRPGQNHFANDIAVDAQGNAYITDSLSPLIYKVDPQGAASVFLENNMLSGGSGFGLNGIVYHPDGYLLVAKANDGSLFKVPLSNPSNFTKVATNQNLSLTGADGLVLTDPKTLLLVSGSQSTVFRLTTTTDWASATEAGRFATGAVSPTTITRRADAAYVLYPYQATSPRFAIVRVGF
ncbi:SMP-30/gluconolactonase/LRE family protein [Hymenobacter metallicola]|uniref:SMP-30/Gluconolactonase/LRE-like region domain-containing protein n=1 Tax=Hymenobacter metallicola TaxID=2563114 RepID=A0A4Z0PUA2_9BACT|nr:SMP-30/gluconolactonase/LRE family protein [Hymenobacter metallicola]TGE21075.1 hypothetical protein E5K02_23985 [Hymenobacter metallicola]